MSGLFTVALLDGAETFRRYLEPVLRLLADSKQLTLQIHSQAGKAADWLFASQERLAQGQANRTPATRKFVLSGEPEQIPEVVGRIVIDSKRLNPRYLYLPFGVLSFAERYQNQVADLLRPKSPEEIASKTQFCAYLYNKSYATREQLFRLVNSFKPVTVLGANLAAKPPQPRSRPSSGKRIGLRKIPAPVVSRQGSAVAHDRDLYVVGRKTFYDSSVEKYRPFRFVICCENNTLPGMFTEKIVSAMLAHSIPIYFGTRDISEVFNAKSFINANDFVEQPEKLLATLRDLETNPAAYRAVFEQPWFVNNQLPAVFQQDYLLASLQRLL